MPWWIPRSFNDIIDVVIARLPFRAYLCPSDILCSFLYNSRLINLKNNRKGSNAKLKFRWGLCVAYFITIYWYFCEKSKYECYITLTFNRIASRLSNVTPVISSRKTKVIVEGYDFIIFDLYKVYCAHAHVFRSFNHFQSNVAYVLMKWSVIITLRLST